MKPLMHTSFWSPPCLVSWWQPRVGFAGYIPCCVLGRHSISTGRISWGFRRHVKQKTCFTKHGWHKRQSWSLGRKDPGRRNGELHIYILFWYLLSLAVLNAQLWSWELAETENQQNLNYLPSTLSHVPPASGPWKGIFLPLAPWSCFCPSPPVALSFS